MPETELLFDGPEMVSELTALGVSHVIWVPDSTTGRWESALTAAPELHLVRVCREGEAWPLAGGLWLGGKQPVVVMQSTGLFESGDALRNIVMDLQLPIFAIIGARNWLIPQSRDSAKRFLLPIVQAWGISFDIIETADDKPRLAERFKWTQREKRPGMVLLAEGKG